MCCGGVGEEKEEEKKRKERKTVREKTVTFKYPDGEGEIRVRNCRQVGYESFFFFAVPLP